MATYMETAKKVQDWCLAQSEPFSYIEMIHAVQPLVDACECAREDVAIRAFSKLGQDGLISIVTPKQASNQKYLSVEMQQKHAVEEAAKGGEEDGE